LIWIIKIALNVATDLKSCPSKPRALLKLPVALVSIDVKPLGNKKLTKR